MTMPKQTFVRPTEPRKARSNVVWTIFFKEFREIFRDRRTVLSVIIGPLIVTPGIFALLGIAIGKKVEAAKLEVYKVGIVAPQASPRIADALGKTPGLEIQTVTAADAAKQIKERKLSAAAVLPVDAEAKIAAGNAVPVQILEDAGSETSRGAVGRIQDSLSHLGTQLITGRLRDNNLPADYATPFVVTEKPIEQGGSTAMMILSQMLPYILILSAFTGAIYAAFDQVAGEKERGTLETLLVSPASRRDIVLGKFGAVVGVCLISSVLAIIGFMLPFISHLKVFDFLTQGNIHLQPMAIGVILLVLLPLSVLFAGLLLAVSTFARNQKEAQTYLGMLFPLIAIPSVLSMVIGDNAGMGVALIPILNASIIIKQALNGTYNLTFILVAFGVSAAYAAFALLCATYLFQKESVLIKA